MSMGRGEGVVRILGSRMAAEELQAWLVGLLGSPLTPLSGQSKLIKGREPGGDLPPQCPSSALC